MNVVEQQRKEAEEIALSLFRFRARRGTGVFYASLSTLPLFATVLAKFFTSYELLAVMFPIAIALWFVSRICGFQSFAKMSYSIDLLRGKQRQIHEKRNFNPTGLILGIWPWIAFIVAEIQGLTSLAVIFPIIWIIQFVLLRVFSIGTKRSKKGKVSVLDPKLEDWVVLAALPIAAALTLLPGVFFGGFVIVSPFLLFAGIKSLYDAPRELAQSYEP